MHGVSKYETCFSLKARQENYRGWNILYREKTTYKKGQEKKGEEEDNQSHPPQKQNDTQTKKNTHTSTQTLQQTVDRKWSIWWGVELPELTSPNSGKFFYFCLSKSSTRHRSWGRQNLHSCFTTFSRIFPHHLYNPCRSTLWRALRSNQGSKRFKTSLVNTKSLNRWSIFSGFCPHSLQIGACNQPRRNKLFGTRIF